MILFLRGYALLPFIAAVASLTPWSSAQPVEEKPGPPEAPVLEGLWPTEKLTRLLMERWTEDVSGQFELDETQRERVAKDMVGRWSGFLKEHRHELQPLLNEFVEMRMELKPPSKERVQAWSRKAIPAFERVKEQMRLGTDEFREVLHPGQRIKFEIEALKFNAGMVLAEQQLQAWKEGRVEEEDFWEPTRSQRRKRREQREAKEQDVSVPAREADPIAAELDAWDQYVKEFIVRYALDEGQKTTVRSCLAEIRERATGYRERRREEIAKLEARIRENSGSEAELEDIRNGLHEVYGPVDEMFEELRRRMDQVLNETQRAAAGSPTGPSTAP